MPTLHVTLDLPAGFHTADLLAFHQRDRQAVAERVGPDMLEKGLIWQGQAACLTVRFSERQAEAKLAVDSASTAAEAGDLSQLVRRMLGLNQPVAAFEESYRRHPQLGALIARQAGLRVPLAATPFEALSWAITGQQISVSAALSMRRKLIKAAGVVHSGGLGCYPDARRLASLNEADFRAAGFFQSKAQTLIAISRQVASGDLPLDDWLSDLPVDAAREQLLAIRGIGPWTVNYTLLRGYGWLDGSLHGDAAVRRGLQMLLDRPDKISEAAARDWLSGFSPWRGLLAAHLWAWQSVKA